MELHPDLAEALSVALGPREDRDPDGRLFADSGSDALRTSIAKACRALGMLDTEKARVLIAALEAKAADLAPPSTPALKCFGQRPTKPN